MVFRTNQLVNLFFKKIISWVYIEYYIENKLQRNPIRRWADEHREIFLEYGFTNI